MNPSSEDTSRSGFRTDYFTCPICDRVTFSPDDIANRYCPCCGGPNLPRTCEHNSVKRYYVYEYWDQITGEELRVLMPESYKQKADVVAAEVERVLIGLYSGLKRVETEHAIGYWVKDLIRIDVKQAWEVTSDG